MARKPLPSRNLVRQLLDYDPETGVLTWRWRPQKMFLARRNFLVWNQCFAHKEAGTILVNGYVSIGIEQSLHMAHRLIWLLVYGEPIPEEIDHIDGRKHNNKLTNLRAATRSENQANAKIRTDSTTGVKGVSAYRDGYMARISVNGEKIFLGLFSTLREAAAARREAAERLHGEFARHD